MGKIDILINQSKKLTSLIEEYKKIKEVEKYDYYVRQSPNDQPKNGSLGSFIPPVYRLYELIRVSDGVLIRLDYLSRIKSYLNLRNIKNVLFD